jgi:2'-5' RNA ligase
MPPDAMRLFVAIELPVAIEKALEELQDDLQRRLPARAVRWTNPHNIHLTLKFLGDTPADRVEAIAGAMTAATRGFEPFSFTVAGFGSFPNARRANVLWVGVPEIPKALAGVQRALDLHLARLGYEREARAFSPHLTIGRVNKSISPGDRERLAAAIAATAPGELGVVPVAEAVLFRSQLLPSGPVYTALARAQLAPAGAAGAAS